mmetsp:Transcript_6885/g.18048  ORF Transcript_6885/g.18048 Transcript_6885/m.18048 type:complete len:129 (+) Transcript_6885:289-675(+)
MLASRATLGLAIAAHTGDVDALANRDRELKLSEQVALAALVVRRRAVIARGTAVGVVLHTLADAVASSRGSPASFTLSPQSQEFPNANLPSQVKRLLEQLCQLAHLDASYKRWEHGYFCPTTGGIKRT